MELKDAEETEIEAAAGDAESEKWDANSQNAVFEEKANQHSHDIAMLRCCRTK
jgi:hypothetical protein